MSDVKHFSRSTFRWVVFVFTLFPWALMAAPEPGGDEVNGPPPVHPIDQAMDLAMEEDPSTAGMMRAIAEAGEAWDQLLNKHYQSLRKILGEAESEKLKKAQRGWIAFRDAEYELLETIYGKMEGTMYRPMHALERMELVKKRALTLGQWVELLSLR